MARSSFQKLAAQISKHLKLPLTAAIIVEFISNIQIIYLLLKSTFDFNISTTFSFAAYAREISAYSGAINVFDPPVSDVTLQAICYGLFGYIVLHIILFITLLILQLKPKVQISEPFWKGISLLYLLHTRLFIFPIHYFFCGIFQLYKNCHQHEGSSDFYCQEKSVTVSIIGCIFNILICVIVELFFYDINKSKNAYAVKTNTLNQAVLLHKTVAILIYFLSTDTGDNGALGAIFNILITILSVYLLFAKLPFYETILLRIKVVFLGIILGSSVILLINACSVKETKLEIPWLILCILLTKCLLIIFDLLLQSIMNGSGRKNSVMTPEKAIHYFILLKEYNFGHVHMEVHRKKFPKDSLITNGSLIRNMIDPSYIKHKKRGKDFENEVYKLALDKLLQVLNKYPKSIPLNLFVAQIYLKKLGNISQVVSLLKRIQGYNLSMVHRNALDEFNIFLKRTYTKQYLKTDSKLKLIDYFHYRQIASDLKDSVQLEIKTHLDFWNEVKQETVNVWRTFQLGYQVEALANSVETTFQQNVLGFYKTSCNILLAYRVYLERVKELPNEARKMMTKFIAISNNPLLRHALDVYSEEQAVIVISLQKDQMGNIIDVSGSTQTLFEIDKNKLIGRNLNAVLPGVFAQIQLNFLQGFAKEVTHQLQHRVKIYGKTSDGSLLELEAQMQLYPVLDKEIKVMILFEKISMPLPIIVVGRDGGILECSESLKRGFEGRTIVPGTTLVQDIFQEFDEINRAFNAVYSNNTKEYHDSSVVKKQKLKKKNPKITIMNEQETPEDLFDKEPAKSTIVHHQKTQSERSKKLCDDYKQGGKLVFTSLEEDRIETVFDVVIEPYILDGYFFKIITFKNQSHHYKKGHPQHSLLFDPFAEDVKAPISSDGGDSDFAEEFLYADERKGVPKQQSLSGSRRQSHFLALKTTSFLHHQASSDIMTIPMERTFHNRLTTDIFAKVATKSIGSTIPKTDEKSKQQPTSLELVKTQKIHQVANSVTSYATTGIHAIKTLKRVFSSGSTFPLARYAGVVSGILILIMIVLCVVFYIFSKAAINKHEADTSIINGVNSRLDGAIATWQLITRMHLDDVGLGKDNVDNVDTQINEEAVLMLQTNNQLDIKLSNTLDDQRLSDVYTSTINLWEPCAGTTTNDDPLNTFEATSILYQRFSVIESLPLSCITNASNDMIYVLNNTGNDYLVASENLVTVARNVVEQALNTNIQSLEFIIIGESLTLIALCVFLFAMVYIIISRYRRLFRALLKIDENHITFRVKQLQKVLKALDGDIEGRNFGIEADGSDEDIILIQKEQSKKGIKTKSFSRRGDNFVVRSFLLYMLKYIILTCVFIIIPAMIFYASLLESIHHFTSLDIIDDQLSVTSKIQYQINLLTSNLYLDMMFRNESNIFIRNQETEVQLPINLELMTTLHDQMIYMFFDDGDDVSDPIVRELLTNTVCNFLVDPSATLAAYCQDATDGGTIGLIALELRYNSLSGEYIATYLADPTYDTADNIVEPYAADVRPVLETLEAAYSFLNDHLLASSESKVSDFESKQIIFFISTLVTTVVAGFMTYFYAIKKLRYLDMGRGKILKLLPYNMITENRALDYYLKREFSNKNLQFGRRN